MKKTTTFLFLFCLLSCTEPENINDLPTVYLNKIKNELVFDSVRVVELETNPDIILGQDLSVKYVDEYIYACDRSFQHCILRFDKNGIFQNKIGKRGRGPEEYNMISDFNIEKNMVEILSYAGGTSSIYRYTINGDFVEKLNFKNTSWCFEKMPSGNYVFGTGYNRYIHNYRIYLTDEKDHELAHFLSNKTFIKDMVPVVEDNFIKYKNKVYFRESYDRIIYTLSDEGVNPIFTFDFGKFNVSDNFFQSGKYMKKHTEIRKKGFCNITNHYVNQDYSFFDIRQQQDKVSLKFHFILMKNDLSDIYKMTIDENTNTILKSPIGLTEENEVMYLVFPVDVVDNPEIEKYNIKLTNNKLNITDNPFVLFFKI